MREYSAPNSLFQYISALKTQKKSVGLVPTMGALHEGHEELIRQARKENDVVVVSIFVNPLQFNNQNDLSNYPRTEHADKEILNKNNVDVLFAPTVSEMYPSDSSISIDFGQLAGVLEGKFRKGHFEGVGVIVSKLLHVCNPDRAYFGLKDLQQFLLIRQMCSDLSFPTHIIGVNTVRNESGLALSSRNLRLSSNGLEVATNIYKGLEKAQKKISNGDLLKEIKKEVSAFYDSISGLEIEYFEIVNTSKLESIDSYDDLNELAICVAGYVDGIRLIDNLYLRLK